MEIRRDSKNLNRKVQFRNLYKQGDKNEFITNLDKKCEDLFKNKDVFWRKYDQFGIQIKKRKRSEWASHWNKFINLNPEDTKVNCSFINIEYREY